MRQPTPLTHTNTAHQWITRSGSQFISFYYRNAFTKYILIFEYILLPCRRCEQRDRFFIFHITLSCSSFVLLASCLCVFFPLYLSLVCFVFPSHSNVLHIYFVIHRRYVVCIHSIVFEFRWPLLFLLSATMTTVEHMRAYSLNEFQIHKA